jgi:hypothetical protein
MLSKFNFTAVSLPLMFLKFCKELTSELSAYGCMSCHGFNVVRVRELFLPFQKESMANLLQWQLHLLLSTYL